MDTSLGILLRRLHLSAGLTQEALAERANLSAQAIGALERGNRRFPHQATVERLATALDLDDHTRAALAAAARRRPAVPPPGDCPSALPYDLADFTGRSAEVAHCHRSAATESIIAIDGMAGSGKSALAVRLAHLLSDRFPDGQFFVDLHGHTPGHDPLSAKTALGDLLRCHGLPGTELPEDVTHRTALWRSRLTGRRTLIVIDNAVDAAQAAPLVPGSPGHLVIITSRHKLTDLDGAAHLSLGSLDPDDAVDLFTRITRQDAERDAIAEVVALCGYLPLAIRLAATRLRNRPSWTVRDLGTRLRDEQERLPALSAGNRSVAGAFELSYRHLADAERRAFRFLGLLPGNDIGPEATAALCGTSVAEARRTLERLADAHLLSESAVERYTCHDLLRRYAAKIVASEPEPVRHAALGRLLDLYLRLTASAGAATDAYHWFTPADVALVPMSQDEAWDWWSREHANLLAAVPAAAQAGLHAHAWQLAQALVPWHSRSGQVQDRHDCQRIALSSARQAGDQDAEAHALVDLAAACHQLGEVAEAHRHYEAAIALGHPHAGARALARLGTLHLSVGGYRLAEDHLLKARALFGSLGLGRDEGVTLVALAELHERSGNDAAAAHTFAEALNILDSTGPRTHKASVHTGLGKLYAKTGELGEAERQLGLALRHARAWHDRAAELRTLTAVGSVRAYGGDPDGAVSCFHQVLDAGLPLGAMRARVLSGLGVARARLGDHTEAMRLHHQALAIATAHDARDLRAQILIDLGDTCAAAGDPCAGGHYRSGLALARELGSADQQRRARSGLSELGRTGSRDPDPLRQQHDHRDHRDDQADAGTGSDRLVARGRLLRPDRQHTRHRPREQA